ncbi:MAG: hypothetical protein M3O46_22900 [Myxococcota bacterium]|nr:hypothetical protein [Myxococcota bacterium]
MRALARGPALLVIALCSSCSLIDLGGLGGTSSEASGDASSDASGERFASSEAAGDDGAPVALVDATANGDAGDPLDGSEHAYETDAVSAPDRISSGEAASDASDAPEIGTTDAAAGDASDGKAPVCTGDLSQIGTADFRVAFTITTRTTQYQAILNQRSVCNPGSFWDVRVGGFATGVIYAEIDDGTHFTNIATAVAINDGVAHDIVFARSAGTLTVQVDGAVQGRSPGTLASTASFGRLAALRQGTDVCDGMDGTQPLVGTLANVCFSP